MAKRQQRTLAAQSEATVSELVAVGREAFTHDGYMGANLETIVQRANYTRGALYHHFNGKEGLFRAVLQAVQNDVAQRIEQAAATTDDPWAQLLLGCRAFLTASLDPQVRQIMLIDAPAVLGWEVWRKMDTEGSMRLLHESLSELAAQGILRVSSVEALTHLLSGAMNEAALWIVSADDPAVALEAAAETLTQWLESLRTPHR